MLTPTRRGRAGRARLGRAGAGEGGRAIHGRAGGGQGKQEGRGAGRASAEQVRAGFLLGAPRPPGITLHPNGEGFGVLLYCLTAKKSFAGRRHCSPRIPGGFALPHRSDGTLGRGPRSEPRAPMQMVSGALGSLGV